MNVPADCDQKTLLEVLCRICSHIAADDWAAECARGLVLDMDERPVAADKIVRAGERYRHKFPNITEPEVNGRIEILHEDEALIVVNKPAPLPMHSNGRFYRNTLQHILNIVYHPQKPHPAHRLDANTTGLVLITRTRHFAGKLQPQFERGQVEKVYLARVQGRPAGETFSCAAPITGESGLLGSRSVDLENGLESRTEFRILKNLADGTTLLEARPLTGRTNQIRIHCAHLGFPVVGDPAYRAGGKLGDVQTLGVDDPPLCLHAWKVSFAHPQTRVAMTFTAQPPPWAG